MLNSSQFLKKVKSVLLMSICINAVFAHMHYEMFTISVVGVSLSKSHIGGNFVLSTIHKKLATYSVLNQSINQKGGYYSIIISMMPLC